MIPMGPRSSAPPTEAAKLAQRKAQSVAQTQDRMDLPRAGPAPKVLGGPPPVSPPMTSGPTKQPVPGYIPDPGSNPMTGIAAPRVAPPMVVGGRSMEFAPGYDPTPTPDTPTHGGWPSGYQGPGYNKGGTVKGYAKGGKVSSASKRADGIAMKGKTKGRFV